jgi:hypothetical protein
VGEKDNNNNNSRESKRRYRRAKQHRRGPMPSRAFAFFDKEIILRDLNHACKWVRFFKL